MEKISAIYDDWLLADTTVLYFTYATLTSLISVFLIYNF